MQCVYQWCAGGDDPIYGELMLSFLPHVVWAGVAIFAILQIRAMVQQFVPVAAAATQGVVELPEDLVALAMNEKESWAQEEVVRAMRERYDTLKDWNLVRTAFGVARRV